MSVVNKGVQLAILFLIVAYLIVPYAIKFVDQFQVNNSGNAIASATVIGGIVLILILVFLFKNIGIGGKK